MKHVCPFNPFAMFVACLAWQRDISMGLCSLMPRGQDAGTMCKPASGQALPTDMRTLCLVCGDPERVVMVQKSGQFLPLVFLTL